MVDIAQLVRVPGCGPGGRGFESHYPPCKKAVRMGCFLMILLLMFLSLTQCLIDILRFRGVFHEICVSKMS